MKLLFTADIHIKLGQKNVPVEWARNRYSSLFKQFEELQSKADMFIIGGDVFDKLPSMEELELYYDMLGHCVIPTIIIPGNHESLKKDTTFLTYLKKVTQRLNKLVTIVDDYYTHANNEFDIIPYNRLKDYSPAHIDFHSETLITHVRGEIPPHVKPEVNLDLFERWTTVLAGDLHSYSNSQRNILYPGSPVTTSFHRSLVDTGVILFDTTSHTHDWIKLEVPQLIRETVQAGDPTPATDYHHTIYEVEGSIDDLGVIEDSELIDKKVVKRQVDTALMLDPKMSMAEELKEYLLYIMQVPEDTADRLVNIFNDNLNKIAME